MASRPTIKDLADAADVSVSTVNRAINSPDKVRRPTLEHVMGIARQIGFYGVGTIEYSLDGRQTSFKLAALLQSPSRTFYASLSDALETAAKKYSDARIELTIEYLGDLAPDNVAEHLRDIASRHQAVALVAAQHPIIEEAIDEVVANGTVVVGLIGELSSHANVGFVGHDSWKVGRTAAWAFDKICPKPGKIGILVGNPRIKNQELNESGFRSYFREHNSTFTLLEPQSTFESIGATHEITGKLLKEHPDLAGLFVSGGGITGALAALSENRPDGLVTVSYELFEATRTALIDGRLTMVIAHRKDEMALQAINTMVRSIELGPDAGSQKVILDFDIFTRENI